MILHEANAEPRPSIEIFPTQGTSLDTNMSHSKVHLEIGDMTDSKRAILKNKTMQVVTEG